MALIFEVRKNSDEEKGQASWIVTYADLVTLLLCLFVLLFAISKTEDHKLKALSNAFRMLPWASSPFMKEGSDSVVQLTSIAKSDNSMYFDADERTISFSDMALFKAGSAQLRKGAMKKLDKISRILYQIPNSVIIEGHTDNVPIQTNRFPSNWELSAARAAAVARALEKMGIKGKRIEVRAFGSTRPKTANDSKEGKQINRRINIMINP
jgi:chemotaxis protein MotB